MGRKRKERDETVEEDFILLRDALLQLDARMPASKFPSYADKLEANGFAYAQNVVHSKHERDLFTRDVGMPRGLVPTFLHEVEAIVRKAKTAKRARLATGKENLAPEIINLTSDSSDGGDDDDDSSMGGDDE